MPHLALQRMLLPGVDVKTMNSGKVKSGLGKDALAQGGFDSIATVVVPSGGLTSIVFAGIPQGYEHLQIRALARGNRTPVTYDSFSMRFNGDTGSNYSYHVIYGDGRSSAANADNGSSTSAIAIGNIPGSASLTNSFGVAIIDVLNYAAIDKNKTVRSLNGYESNTTGYGGIYSCTAISAGAWYNTSAISTITLNPDNSPFQEFSHFALYGVK